MLAPPTRSAAFSRLAIQRAALLDAPPWLSANTEAPRASGFMKASAWIETNRSAWTRRAFLTRSCSGTKKSASRVSIARMFGLRVEAVAQEHRDRQDDVLLVQAGRPDRAGILAAVAGIDGDDDEAIDLRLRGLRRQRRGGRIALRIGARAGRARRRRCRRRERRRRRAERDRAAGAGGVGHRRARRRRRRAGRADAADELAERVLDRLRGVLLGLLAVADEVEQRVALLGRMQVEDEAVPVGRDRLEREQLRRARLLQVDDQADDARLVLADAERRR